VSLLGDTLGTQDGCYPKADAAEVGLFSMSISGTIIIVYLIAADARGALIRWVFELLASTTRGTSGPVVVLNSELTRSMRSHSKEYVQTDLTCPHRVSEADGSPIAYAASP
jgi:hypothetical protein